jgi:hypothetical protein
LLCVGEGRIAARLLAHLAKCGRERHPQGVVFRLAGRLEYSWAAGPAWLPHQRLELENDLIAAHLLATGAVPAAQFLGEKATPAEPPVALNAVGDGEA